MCGDRHTLEQHVRVVPHDVAVLERAGLALVGIADEILVALELLRHEAPLESGRETGAAASAQRRFLHLGDHIRRRRFLGENFLERLVAPALDVIREPPVLTGEAGHQNGVRPVVQESVAGAHRALDAGCGVGPRVAAPPRVTAPAAASNAMVTRTLSPCEPQNVWRANRPEGLVAGREPRSRGGSRC